MEERFVLQEARVRGDRIAIRRDVDPVEVDWPGLRELAGGSQTPQALLTLRRLSPGDYIGQRRRNGRVENFMIGLPGASRSIRWLVEKHPTFEAEVLSIYRVESAEYDVRLVEQKAS